MGRDARAGALFPVSASVDNGLGRDDPAQRRPTERFTDRVAAYVQYRPHYPYELVAILTIETGLAPAHHIADIGCGTGISSEPFLRNGNRVYGIEPNKAMRNAGREALKAYPNFTTVAGTAEATTLPSAAVDYVIAGQAFHWFDLEKSWREFGRILRPGGWVALFWNSRRSDASPFMREYEAVVCRYSTDYDAVHHSRVGSEALATLFGDTGYQQRELANPYWLDFGAILGRTASSSYAPATTEPAIVDLAAELKALFDVYQDEGRVRFDYQTNLFFGRICGASESRQKSSYSCYQR